MLRQAHNSDDLAGVIISVAPPAVPAARICVGHEQRLQHLPHETTRVAGVGSAAEVYCTAMYDKNEARR